MSVEDGGRALLPPVANRRAGWADMAKEIAAAGDDALVWLEFGNEDDSVLVWDNAAVTQ